jgi:hypothetical protein
LQEITRADSGDSSAHDQDVYVCCFINHCFTHEQSLCDGLGSPYSSEAWAGANRFAHGIAVSRVALMSSNS